MIAALPLAGAPCAEAAQPGELAATSRGSVQIVANVAVQASVTGLADTSLTTTASTGAPLLVRACVRSNSGSGLYSLTATGTSADGAFVLAATDGTLVPFALAWTDAAAKAATLLPGTPLDGLAASRAACAATFDGGLAVTTPASGVPAVAVVTLTFSPL